MNKIHQDFNLIYSGGSGGFLLLHLLLLSQRYFVKFRRDWPLADILQHQWNVTTVSQWKKSEIHPVNDLTLCTASDLPKIYVYCNPEQCDSFAASVSVGLWTDFHSQQELAWLKRAMWYQQPGSGKSLKFRALRELLKNWQNHYQAIQDPSWPPCASPRHLNQLPAQIAQEVKDNEHSAVFLNYCYQDPVTEFRGHDVYAPVVPYLNRCEHVIRLQDLVNSEAEILPDMFDIGPVTQQQRELIRHWRGLHPSDLLESIGIKSTVG